MTSPTAESIDKQNGEPAGDTIEVPSNEETSDPPKGRDRTFHTKIIIFVILSLVSLAHAFDATCICVALPTIASELDATVSESLGLATSFLLTTTIAQPVYSELSHAIGKKIGYLISVSIFLAGTIVCGVARSSLVLLVGRTIQGLGAAGPQALSAMILTDLFPIRQRALFLSLLNISWALGTVTGPILGGYFTQCENAGWRWIFWINVPLLSTSFMGAWLLLGYHKPQGRLNHRLRRIDWVGIILFGFSGVALLLPLSWGGSKYPWKSAKVISPVVLSAIGFIALAVYETFYAKHPMFRPSVFSNRSTCLQFVNITIHGVLMWMALYYMSVFYLGVKDYSPLKTGVWALPATLTVAPIAAFAGWLVAMIGTYHWYIYSGWALMILAFGLLKAVDENMSTGIVLFFTFVLGVGMGLLIPAMTFGVQATTSNEDSGHAIATVFVLRSAGQCLGVAVGLAVFSSRLQVELGKLGYNDDAAQHMMKSMRQSLRTGGPEDWAVIHAVVTALGVVWITGCAMASVAGVLTIAIKCPRLPEDDQGPPLVSQATRSLIQVDEERLSPPGNADIPLANLGTRCCHSRSHQPA
ncbi:major facilitator superfamily domain-containing protein [Thelonectria olida]|uniref:Major facilitator superfamily domain-containing protein n=1 Tax=Thelonectria olida TaxID=1576542 RepID=A0A9P8WLR3_9HYPO|nr:major facilitator superfamily domain-containing protein [Thelonectria olida]